MHYYEHHIGDYAAATAHLSWDEDMAYTRLLRAYYHHERTIPDDQKYRLARASTPAQRKAVDSVLSEFFTLKDGAWSQKRAETEINRYRDKQAKAKRSARARWGKDESDTERNAEAMRTHSEGNADAEKTGMRTQCESNANQTPITNNQEPITKNQDHHSQGIGTPCTRDDENPKTFDGQPVSPPSMAAAVCVALRAAGMASVNPSSPKLLALLEAGATVDAFVQAAAEARVRGASRPFAYLLGVVEGQLQDVRQLAQRLPQKAAATTPNPHASHGIAEPI